MLTATQAIAEKRSLSILLAEDNLVNQKIIVYMLTKLGYEPAVVNNGVEAVTAISSKNYDLVLMDVQMPEMDGLAATGIIRRKTGAQPFIIAMTANSMQGDKEECMVAGMDDYISKPITMDDLKLLLKKYAEEVRS